MQALRVGPCVATGRMLLTSGFHSEVSFVHRLTVGPIEAPGKENKLCSPGAHRKELRSMHLYNVLMEDAANT